MASTAADMANRAVDAVKKLSPKASANKIALHDHDLEQGHELHPL